MTKFADTAVENKIIMKRSMNNNWSGIFIVITVAVITLLPGAFMLSGQASSSTVTLSKRLDAILASKALNGAQVSVCVSNLATNKVIYSKNHKLKLIPASNMKIVISAAALTMLKPNFKFKTEVYATASTRAGVLNGDLYIKGYGDPYLIDEELWIIARDVAYRGVKEILGRIVADESYFDTVRFGKGWGEVVSDPYFAPTGALSINFNTFVVDVIPGGAQGVKAKLRLMPPARHIFILNKVYTVAAGGSTSVIIEEDGEEGNSYVARGQVGIKHSRLTIRRTIREPGLYAASAFAAYLNSWGVKTSGKISRGVKPPRAYRLVIHYSRPLSKILYAVNKLSNNFITEQLLKTLGAKFGKHKKGEPPGTTAKGINVVAGFLKKLGINEDEYIMADGSGLSRDNRFPSIAFVKLLTYMHKEHTISPEFEASLGTGGVDGTIEKRFKSPKLRRRVRAKTGHLDGVNTLSGYLYTKKGKKLAFSILINDFKTSHRAVEKVEQDFLLALSGY